MSGRGRGRPPGASDARERLITAGRELFSAQGFSATSMRSVAKQAEVDPSLVVHYFGTKEGLFAATMDLPFNPAERLAGAIEGGADGFGERLVRTFVSTWDEHRETFSTMARSALTGDSVTSPVLDIARDVIAPRLLELTGDPVRAQLLVGQILGLGMARYVVRLEPLASASVDEVVAIYAPAIQAAVV